MKKPERKDRSQASDDLRPEYSFDYSKARPNPYAARLKGRAVAVVLDPDDSVNEIKRHFGVVAEGLRDEIRAVGEGQVQLRQDLDAFRGEVREDSRQTKSLIRSLFGELDRGVASLESREPRG